MASSTSSPPMVSKSPLTTGRICQQVVCLHCSSPSTPTPTSQEAFGSDDAGFASLRLARGPVGLPTCRQTDGTPGEAFIPRKPSPNELSQKLAALTQGALAVSERRFIRTVFHLNTH